MTKPQKWWGEEDGRLPQQGRIVNRNELARIFGVVPSSINKYQEIGMPVVKKGRRGVPDEFDAADCVWWRIDHVVRQRLGDFGDDLSLRKLAAETGLKQRERDRVASELIPSDMFGEALKQSYAGVDEVLAAIPDEAAPLVAREASLTQCHRIIERAINNARRKLVSPDALKAIQRKLGSKS